MKYTNSPLISYTKLSPNHSGQRTHNIDRITPHCVVGQATVERLGDIFGGTRKVSANYGIGRDGKVGLYVEEKNRSWCSSSGMNDHRAITIECASDSSEPYAFKAVVYDKLIDLCVDICKRNGKNRLIWFGNKDKTLAYEPQAGEMILTVHRWFANKSCPGSWMYARMGDLAEKVTAQLGDAPVQQEPVEKKPQIVTPVATTAADNEKTIWDFLKGKGLNDFAVAGIMGNLYAESGFKPTNLQNAYETKLGYTDATYTAAVDNGTYANFINDSAGYGLVQWTYWSRKQALLEFAKAAGKSIGDLGMQLDFMWKEMRGYKSMIEALNGAATILEASNAVLLNYERPADQSESIQNKRAGYGKTYYDKFAGTAEDVPTATLYRVQAGAYSKRENAMKQLARVKAAGFTDAYITTESGGTVVVTPEETAPTYLTYTVKDGDTLWGIAKKYLGNGADWEKIAKLNGMTGSVIRAGLKIKIPE